jgi:hypothetical protein
MVNGKAKGNTFERKIANFLSERFKEHVGIEKPFSRNSNSGAYFGGKNQIRVAQFLEEHQNFGDIIAPDNFKYVVEAKSYKTPFSINAIITQKSKQLDVWIEQSEQDAENASRESLLVIKYNNTTPFVMIKEELFNAVFVYKGYYAYEMELFFNMMPDVAYFISSDIP